MSEHRVLIVDDDRDTRDLYQVLLDLSGYSVAASPTVADGLIRARDFRPHVIVSDWRLPDGDAFVLLEGLRSHARTRRIPVIAVTGVTLDPSGLDRARQLGCANVYLKPLTPDALIEAIRRALDGEGTRTLRAAARRIQRAARALESGAHGSDLRTMASTLASSAPATRAAGVAVILADDAGRCVAANEGASQLTGYAPDELARLTVWELTPAPRAGAGRELWRQFIASGHQEGTYTVKRRTGDSVEARYVAIADITPGLHLSALTAIPAALCAA